jgi:hypothetical protein
MAYVTFISTPEAMETGRLAEIFHPRQRPKTGILWLYKVNDSLIRNSRV